MIKNRILMSYLVKDGPVSIHHQNLQKLTVEMFKVSRGLSPEIVNELFQCREQISYELRQGSQLQIPWVHSVFGGTENAQDSESSAQSPASRVQRPVSSVQSPASSSSV